MSKCAPASMTAVGVAGPVEAAGPVGVARGTMIPNIRVPPPKATTRPGVAMGGLTRGVAPPGPAPVTGMATVRTGRPAGRPQIRTSRLRAAEEATSELATQLRM